LHVVHEEVDVLAYAMFKPEHQDGAAADHHVGASEAFSFEIVKDLDGRSEYLFPAIARHVVGLAHDRSFVRAKPRAAEEQLAKQLRPRSSGFK
jgi:hypothetical protein